jgi:aspartate/methionine/tyrosine aminotransferase
MFEKERILQLHSDGNCVAAISLRLNVSSDIVRAVVAQAAAVEALRSLQPDAVRRASRAQAQKKRTKALRLLKEAEAVLNGS